MLLQLAVGPICLFVLQTAASSGFLAAEAAVLGVALADATYILAAIWGLGATLRRSTHAEHVLRYFGAAVLTLFGAANVLGAFGISFLPGLSLAAGQSTGSAFSKALLLTLSNPLTILFWAGVFASKMAEEGMRKKQAHLFGLGTALSTLCFLTAAAAAGSAVSQLLSGTFMAVMNAAVGLALIGFGIRIAYKRK